jgi:dimethylglycine catabolism A
VIATGAQYRFGLVRSRRAARPRRRRLARLAWLFTRAPVRDWFYYQARQGTADRFRLLAKPGQTVIALGDAVEAGKSKQAIASAFEAALLAWCRR